MMRPSSSGRVRKAFHKGGNSSCRAHIRHHYEIYKAKCEKAGVTINHWAIPREIWRDLEEQKEEEKLGKRNKKKGQQMLGFQSVTGPCEFTRDGALHVVANLIVTNNQVSTNHQCHRHGLTIVSQPLALADNAAFRNALVAMRPKSTTKDLASSHEVQAHIHNGFVKYMKDLKEEIRVSSSSLSLYTTYFKLDITGEGLNNLGLLVGRYDEDGILGGDCALDRGQGGKVEAASVSHWVQGIVRRP
jgi:hypothetical protein